MAITNKQVKAWTDYFNSLSKEEKKVALAKDAIAQIKAGRTIPTNVTYFKSLQDEDFDIQKNIDKIKCEVCALGCLFISYIKYNNKYNTKDLEEDLIDEIILEDLSKYFTEKELVLIELAFEKWSYDAFLDFDTKISRGIAADRYVEELDITDEEIDMASEFNGDRNADEVLIEICKNIIKNKGKFVL
ncbi:MAG TPA: hypothetical protein PKD00_00090 [Burkholderiales bacterium]|nr:hypothetical protein [Burkholderiales bacterium]